MERWALVSGLQGDLDLYEQIQKDLKRQRGIANLFVLGDLIARIATAMHCWRGCGNPNPQISPPTASMAGGRNSSWPKADTAVNAKRTAFVSNREMTGSTSCWPQWTQAISWLASLQFGFIELDCALIHGSSADVGDQLTEDTSPLILLDRLTRLDVNRLFT